MKSPQAGIFALGNIAHGFFEFSADAHAALSALVDLDDRTVHLELPLRYVGDETGKGAHPIFGGPSFVDSCVGNQVGKRLTRV
ncbi:MAG TPA: hypothetical protein VK760_01810 [Candidatus Acidoferrales bacterium]|jgi:hypothetical protein|nr:hypothetical protein [Candidatus Acidoferrales bacterium]